MKIKITETLCAFIGAVATLSLTATPGQSQTIYATGFEAPAFSLGSLNGQGAWSGDGVIENSVVESGSQALQINGSSSSFQDAVLSLDYTIGSQSLIVESDFLLNPHDSTTYQLGVSISGNTGFLGQLAELEDGFIIGNTDSSPPAQPFANGVWHQLEISLNFQSETMTGYVDGNSLGTVAINTVPLPTAITSITLYNDQLDENSPTAYFDNVSLTAVPEPATPALAGLGGVGLMLFHRRRQHLGVII